MEYKILTFEEFEKIFKSVKHSKAVGQDDTDNKVYDGFSYPLFIIFNSSFAKAPSIFKVASTEGVGNYRLISDLTIFSKVLEIIMYGRTFS